MRCLERRRTWIVLTLMLACDEPKPTKPDRAIYQGSAQQERHEELLGAPARSSAEVVFIGDSITAAWETDGRATWQSYVRKYRAFNLGVPGDTVDAVIARVRDGALANTHPRAIVLLIGTNDKGSPVTRLATRIITLVRLIREQVPASSVVLVGILPRGAPDDPLRHKNARVNAKLASLNEPNVTFLDVGDAFLDPHGAIVRGMKEDELHLDASGYVLLDAALAPVLSRLVGPASEAR